MKMPWEISQRAGREPAPKPPLQRGRLKPEIRSQTPSSPLRKLWERFKGKCFYCDIPTVLVDPKIGGDTAATRDHIIPRSRKRGHKGDNLVLACHRCNTWKGDKSAEEFLTRVRQSRPLTPRVETCD